MKSSIVWTCTKRRNKIRRRQSAPGGVRFILRVECLRARGNVRQYLNYCGNFGFYRVYSGVYSLSLSLCLLLPFYLSLFLFILLLLLCVLKKHKPRITTEIRFCRFPFPLTANSVFLFPVLLHILFYPTLSSYAFLLSRLVSMCFKFVAQICQSR